MWKKCNSFVRVQHLGCRESGCRVGREPRLLSQVGAETFPSHLSLPAVFWLSFPPFLCLLLLRLAADRLLRTPLGRFVFVLSRAFFFFFIFTACPDDQRETDSRVYTAGFSFLASVWMLCIYVIGVTNRASSAGQMRPRRIKKKPASTFPKCEKSLYTPTPSPSRLSWEPTSGSLAPAF